MAKIIPPSEKQMEIRAKNALKRELSRKLENVILNGNGIMLSASELALIQVKAKGREYTRYQENDSPKGDTVPGVNFNIAA